ncbi:uncharacterized protein LOC135097938 [Scylla paramamosain]|uniref:uncharacterized protein LOC135097938 n=1 Tax=Scylla paramamosain TaxID=85552 RepID=UPI003082F51E
MALPCLAGGYWSLLLLLLTITCTGTGEVLLIHESGKGTAWGYSHLPSTFPLTWSQARSACEAIPGSMLARVDGWQAEAAVEEYLREAAFAEPVWLANRQTLPEVLEDEQREMNHIGNAGVLGSDLSMGGEVGVTLRCAVYRAGVGLVHEICSEAAVSAALCVQRLSSERPQLEKCPASPHRQWFLVNSHTETVTSEPHQQTTVNVIGLHQCHHHHHHHHGHMVRVACRPQEGWELTTCSSEASASKHQQEVKASRAGHRQQSDSTSPRQTPTLTPTHTHVYDYEQGFEQKEYFSLSPQQENRRHKRSAELQPTQRVHTSSMLSSLMHSTPETIPTHRSVIESHESDVDDKVMLYITGYKKSRSDYEKQREDAIRPQHSTHVQTEDRKHDTNPRQHDASATRLKDKHAGRAKNYSDEIMFDPVINEIKTEAESDHEGEGKPSVFYPSDKRNDSAAIHDSASVEESEIHTRTSPAQATNSSKSQGSEEIKDQKIPSTGDTRIILKVGIGPIFVHGPEPQNNTNEEDNIEGNFRALIFPEDSRLENPNENDLSDAKNRPSIPSNESSLEGSSSDTGKTTPSKETTTTPSRPIIFPRGESDDPTSGENVNDDTLFTGNSEKTKSTDQPTVEPTPGAVNSDMLPDVQISESTPVGAATPEDSAVKTEDMTNDSDKNNNENAESDDAEEGTEDPNTNTPRPEESTLNSIISNTTSVNVHQELNSGPSSPHSAGTTVTTEKSKTQSIRLLIAQIFKNIFG